MQINRTHELTRAAYPQATQTPEGPDVALCQRILDCVLKRPHTAATIMLRLRKQSLQGRHEVNRALVYLCTQGLLFDMRLSSKTYFASQQWLRRMAEIYLKQDMI